VKQELLGRVRSVRTELAIWDLAAETWQTPERVTVEEYREDGKISANEHRWNGQVSRSTYLYDQPGRLVETQFCWNGDESAGRVAYEYDDSGRLVRQVGYGHDGARVIEERTYAPDGSHMRVHPFPEGVTDVYCPVDGADYYFSAIGAREMVTAYDPGDRFWEMRLKNAEGKVLRRFVLTRAESGTLVRDELLRDGQSATITAEYVYDVLGRRTATVRRLFGLSEERQTYSYDDRGNQTEVVTERGQTRFAYKYDGHGNWIERLTSHRHEPNPDFTRASIDSREIAYYS
jgi:YD repeat-containing protein